MVQRVIQFSLVVTGLVLALEFLDATALVGAVVGTAGLAGLALGFAFKDIAENYLAGIILSLRNPFAKSDLIVVGEHEGKVVRLAGRETILMTVEGNHVPDPERDGVPPAGRQLLAESASSLHGRDRGGLVDRAQ